MEQHITLIVFPITDMEKSVAFYSKFFGAEPYYKSQYYTGFKIGNIEIGLTPDTKGPISYIDVPDIKKNVEEMKEIGAEIVKDISDVGNGLLVAQIKDMDGNIIGFRQQPAAK